MQSEKSLHSEILSVEQKELLPFLKKFSGDFVLVDGTAVALYLGHRRSIDFDLFSNTSFDNERLIREIMRDKKIDRMIVNKLDELTVIVSGVKLTFFNYPFLIKSTRDFENVIRMPDLLTLSAMKAFALGMRAKWKDCADLYFILKDYFSVAEISGEGRKIFGDAFNEKLFRVQLGYFERINYDEKVSFMPGFEVNDDEIKSELTNFAL